MFNPETANTLPNGAIVLDRRRVGDTWLWLCDFGGAMPYVTWVSGHNSADHTEWGHYFVLFRDALKDFQERIQAQCRYARLSG